MEHPLAEGQEACVFVFVRGLACWDRCFVFLVLVVHRMGLVASHLLNFGNRNVVEMFHCFLVHIREVVVNRRFFAGLLGLHLLRAWLEGELGGLSQLGGRASSVVAAVCLKRHFWREIDLVVPLVVVLFVIKHRLCGILESWVVVVLKARSLLSLGIHVRPLLLRLWLEGLTIVAALLAAGLALKLRLLCDRALEHLNFTVILRGTLVIKALSPVHVLLMTATIPVLKLAHFLIFRVSVQPFMGVLAVCLKIIELGGA
jgi:hypothetical protein